MEHPPTIGFPVEEKVPRPIVPYPRGEGDVLTRPPKVWVVAAGEDGVTHDVLL